jgi:dGTPase
MILSYKTLLKEKRLRNSKIVRADIAEETDSDRGRIIYSKAFRRLQGKTQVFPLDGNPAVRVRLTHSLEVAHLGRQIADKILLSLESTELEALGLESESSQIAFVNIVETACLMHDIGNPPFGHFGEKAIQEWFRSTGKFLFADSLNSQRKEYTPEAAAINLEDIKLKKCIDPEYIFFESNLLPDFEHFDGNPQGFRIVTRLQWNVDRFGLNLLCSQLAAYLKYLQSPEECKKTKDDAFTKGEKPHKFAKKPGFFFSEKELVIKVREALSLPEYCRYPLAFIMEAADDIAYCMSDIEDGMEKDIFLPNFFREKIIDEWKALLKKASSSLLAETDRNFLPEFVEESKKEEYRNQDLEGFFHFKTALTLHLVRHAADQYVNNHVQILKGEFKESLLDPDSKEKLTLEALKNFAIHNLYTQKEAEDIELAGYRIITGLLNWFNPLLSCSREDFEYIVENKKKNSKTKRSLDLEHRLFHMLPNKHVRVYKDAVSQLKYKLDPKEEKPEFFDYEFKTLQSGNVPKDAYEWFFRAHLIVDYISGMTDNYALEKFQLYSGIRVN